MPGLETTLMIISLSELAQPLSHLSASVCFYNLDKFHACIISIETYSPCLALQPLLHCGDPTKTGKAGKIPKCFSGNYLWTNLQFIFPKGKNRAKKIWQKKLEKVIIGLSGKFTSQNAVSNSLMVLHPRHAVMNYARFPSFQTHS